MTKRATVVIGANYGDEGKGRIVDYLASKISGDTTVVRFNGGAQAGHSVQLNDGKRHVFSHFGSGSFAGAHTYLAKHFVCNPILFWKELIEFNKTAGLDPVVAADPRCFVTTPYDILVNQLVEDHRGAGRHGSVGVGFGETIERNNFYAFRLTKSDIKDRKTLLRTVRNIRDHYLPMRLAALGLPRMKHDDHRLSDEVLNSFVEATLKFNSAVITAGAEFYENDAIIFEGAQGLALDQDRGTFPHVTRSNTGLKNVMPIARGLGLALDVIYVTRTFLTRHGAGPLPGEFKRETPIFDPTNVSHAYQGDLRYATLDREALMERIWTDVRDAGGDSARASCSLALTWADQVPPMVEFMQLGRLRVSHITHGPVRDACEEVK